MQGTATKRIDEATKRRLAVQASCDPRTLEKALRGEQVRGLAGHRIRAALAAEGLIVWPSEDERRLEEGHSNLETA